MNRKHALASLAFLAAAPMAQAEILCVNTSNQLVAAFASAQTAGATEIRVRAGNYAMVSPDSSTPALAYSGQSDLLVTGGWTGANNSCVSRLPDADTTVLSAASTGPLMQIHAFAGSANTVELRGLSFRLGLTGSVTTSACLQVESDVGSNAQFIVEQNTFRNCTRTATTGPHGGAIAMVLRDATARVRSNLVTGSFAPGGAVTLTGLGGATFHASNNTIAANLAIPGRSGPNGLQLGASGSGNSFWVQNNVLHGNGGADLQVNGTLGLILGRNIIGTRSPLPAGTIEADNWYSTDPQFAGNGNFRPTADSPMRNSGATVAGGLATTDVAGMPRWIGNAVDRGAYEYDELFGDSFDPLP